MHAENAPHVATGRARLLAETRRIARILDGKLFLWVLEPLVRMECRDGLLGGGNEVFFVFTRDDLYARENVTEEHCNVQNMMHLVELFVELVELRRLRHDVLVHQEWRLDFLVFPLAQKVEPVRDESLIEVDTIIREEVSTMARDLGTCTTLSGKISRYK